MVASLDMKLIRVIQMIKCSFECGSKVLENTKGIYRTTRLGPSKLVIADFSLKQMCSCEVSYSAWGNQMGA